MCSPRIQAPSKIQIFFTETKGAATLCAIRGDSRSFRQKNR